jgi:predicted HD superfamily hydrolase involved in NAD metabolism
MDDKKRAAGAHAGAISAELKKTLSKRTYGHARGTAKTAVMLAGRFGADKNKAAIAGFLHDCAKDLGRDALKAAVKNYGVKITAQEKKIPAIWHGYVAEKMAEKEFGIKDRQILKAIKLHSTGGRRMGKLEKIIYVSDFIEPGREYRESRELRKLLKKNITLDYLVYNVLKEKVKYLRQKELMIHPATKLLFNQIKKKRKKTRKKTRNT